MVAAARRLVQNARDWVTRAVQYVTATIRSIIDTVVIDLPYAIDQIKQGVKAAGNALKKLFKAPGAGIQQAAGA